MKKVILIFGMAFCYLLSFSQETGTFTDPRDNKVYKTVKIGTQVWMAENLAYLPAVSSEIEWSETSPTYNVYGYPGISISDAKTTDNFATYGVLYNWPAAVTACPDGWYLPSDEDWKTLEKYLGMNESHANSVGFRSSGYVPFKLEETDSVHWSVKVDEVTNSSGFTALPGGSRDKDGSFGLQRLIALFWTSTEINASNAVRRVLLLGTDGIGRGDFSKSPGYSVRCLKVGDNYSDIRKELDIDGPVIKTNQGYYQYKTKLFDAASKNMYDAIKFKNQNLVKLLIEKGYDITLPIFIQDFSDFTKNLNSIGAQVWKNGGTIDFNGIHAHRENGYIVTSVKPTPAVKTTPLEFAKEINDKDIISVLEIEMDKRLAQIKIEERQDSIRYSRTDEIKDSLLNKGYIEIKPGKGFDSFEVGKTTVEEITTKLGSINEMVKIDNKEYKIIYKELGLTFYCDSKSKAGILYRISIESPFKGITSEGVELNKSLVKDVLKLYGTDNHQYGTDNFYYWEYDGIRFYKEMVNKKSLEEKIIKIDVLDMPH